MRLLFVHDHRFVRSPDGAMLTAGSFPREAWQRYLDHFDELVVVGRDGGLAAGPVRLARSDRPGVRFALVRHHALTARLAGRGGEGADVLRRELGRADAVVVRVPSDLGYLAARLAAQWGLPWAVEAVGCAYDSYRHHGSRLSRAYAPLAMKRMQRVVACAPQALFVTRSFLQRRYPPGGEAVSVSNVEIEPLSAAALAMRAERLRAIAQARRPVVVGTVASLRTQSKGIQTAIAAIARLNAAGIRIEYRVLGAGDRQPWLQQAREAGIADQVHFDGARPAGEGVREWLDGIDLHIQPSLQEGLPRATIEAMSRGCACLGSTAGGLPELLPRERLHRPGDAAALAMLLARFTGDPAALAAASVADRATASAYLPDALRPVRAGFFAQLAERAQRRSG